MLHIIPALPPNLASKLFKSFQPQDWQMLTQRKMFIFGDIFLFLLKRARDSRVESLASKPEGVSVETLFVDVKLYMEIGSL